MHKICIKCGSKNVQKYGHTGAGKQRYRCLSCKACYTWKNKPNKHKRQQSWFKLWINEGFSIRQIMSISGHSASTLKRINRHWLEQPIPTENYDLRRIKYLLLDGTYFRHEHCLTVFMDNESGKIIGHRYCGRENYESVLELAAMLKAKGLCPISVTLDGHQGVIRALKETWPGIKIQRCLYHIEHQGQMWLRTYPKTEAGKALKALLGGLAHIITSDGRARFDSRHEEIKRNYGEFIRKLNSTIIGERDVKKAMTLINNAYKDMWHFLGDRNIPATNNKLEGYFSELKQQYRKHKGLSKGHRKSFLEWYIYYKNKQKTNTF